MIKKRTVISLGGSLIVPDEIGIGFLKQFRKLILKFLPQRQFFIICGGGRTARNYQNAVRKIVRLTRDDLDWLGIHSTRLNAHLLRTIFRDAAHPRVLNHPGLNYLARESVVLAGGWKPGWSTDYVAVRLAQSYGAKEILNLTNVDCLYDRDPYKFKNAKPIYKISWREFRKIVGDQWDPGSNLPFDPVGARLAEKLNISVALLNGLKLKNLERYLSNKSFIGTVIKNP
jgi:uridylate kinase